MPDVPEHEPPSSHTVPEIMHRALCLAGLVEWLSFERDADARRRHAAHVERLRTWLEAPPLGASLSPKERKLLHRKPGTWSEADKLNISWRIECIGVLLWAVQLADALPTYDTQFDHGALTERLNVGAPIEPLVARARLRSPAELDAAWTEAERWHWRSVHVRAYFAPQQDASRRPEMIALALDEPVQLFGKPYASLSFQDFSQAHSIALERHYAFNWLFDGDPWDEVSTDT